MDQIDFKKFVGWPFWWAGALLTILYLLIVGAAFGHSFASLFSPGIEPNKIGDSLAGAFAPLAFIWLVVGIFQQSLELRVQVQELKESVEAQKSLARASNSQERLQVEQFTERVYRLYKGACEDLLLQLLSGDHLQYDTPQGSRASVFESSFLSQAQGAFLSGNRARILDVAKEVRRKFVQDVGLDGRHSDFVAAHRAQRVLALAEDFARADDLRKEALTQFEGGEVLARIDSHLGFEEARKLVDGYVARLKPFS